MVIRRRIMIDTKGIGSRIKEQRKKVGMSQDKVAILLGYSSGRSIHYIEAGKNDISISKINELATILKTTTEYLLGIEVQETQIENKKMDEIKDKLREYILKILNSNHTEELMVVPRLLEKYMELEKLSTHIEMWELENAYFKLTETITSVNEMVYSLENKMKPLNDLNEVIKNYEKYAKEFDPKNYVI